MRPPAQQDRKAIAYRHHAGDYKEETVRQLARIATSKVGGRRFWAGTVWPKELRKTSPRRSTALARCGEWSSAFQVHTTRHRD
jgi:hypothetical protein